MQKYLQVKYPIHKNVITFDKARVFFIYSIF